MATSPALVDAVAKALGISPADAQKVVDSQAAQAQGANQYQPFGLSGNADQGTLWLGSTAATPGVSPLNAENLGYGGGTNLIFTPPGTKRKISVNIQGLNLHNGYSATIVYGDNAPVGAGDEQTAGGALGPRSPAGPNGGSSLGVQIKDPQGHIISTEWLDQDQVKSLMMPTPVIKKQGAADVTLTLDPNSIVANAAKTGATAATDKTGTIAEQLQGIYKLPDASVQGLKHELWLAGYYGSKKLAEVDMTSITNDDISAFGSLMIAASRYYAAGQKITWQDLLAKQAVSGVQAAAKKPTVRLTDPALITKEANDTATKVLGRAPSPQDVQALMGIIQTKESAKLDADTQAGQPYIGTDPAADIEQFFRQKYPNEANAVDWGDSAQAWEQLLRTPSAPQPQVTK